MIHSAEFWQLQPLSDQQLLASLGAVLRTKRRVLAELVAHLGEVEERRLHLEAAYGSMFSYCVSQLGMSEDEACRRIQLARLARRFPALFPEIASGRISLSVALLLEPVLEPSNHLELLAAVRDNSVQRARELLAARFARPDVTSSIRRLPEPRPAKAANTVEPASPPAAMSPASSLLPEAPLSPVVPMLSVPAVDDGAAGASATEAPTALAPVTPALSPIRSPRASSASADGAGTPFALRVPPFRAHRDRIEPLSAQRYRVQFTADAELKTKLEQARDLLRHALPSGDFGPILSRALDLLIADQLRRRFGAGARRGKTGTGSGSLPSARAAVTSPAVSTATASSVPAASAKAPSPIAASPTAAPVVSSLAASPRSTRVRIGRAARRTVLERDGLGCTWVGADGVRCGSRAWLELDHRHPVGKGGGSDPDNLRMLCRAHNLLAAEHEYGPQYIQSVRAARRGNARR